MAIRFEDRGNVDLSDDIDDTQPTLAPVHPGDVLRTEFLQPLRLKQAHLALQIGVSPRRIAALAAGKRPMTPDLAVRLGRFFGMSAEFWLGLQVSHDLAYAEAKLAQELARIHPHPVAAE